VINRRTFVKAGAVAYLAAHNAWSIPRPGASGHRWGRYAGGSVQRQVRRAAQLNMTEHDPVVMDVEAWADYMKRLR